jgi:hypothetical protein
MGREGHGTRRAAVSASVAPRPSRGAGKRDVVGRAGLLRLHEFSVWPLLRCAVPQQNAFRRWRTPRKRL